MNAAIELNNLIVQRDAQIKNMDHLKLVMGLLEQEIARVGEGSMLARPVIEAALCTGLRSLKYIGQLYDEMYSDLQHLNQLLIQ